MSGRIARGPSLVDQAIESLRGEIEQGVWPVGEKIPTEPELVEALGVGRNSLREAIRALVHAGLLETRQGDGTYVTATSDLAGAVRRRVGRAQLLEIFELRRALEVEAARLAALRRTDADLAALERLLAAREAASHLSDLGEFIELDVALHRAIVDAAHNALLTELYDDFATSLRDAVGSTAGAGTTEDQVHAHDALVAAIRAGDAIAAQAETAVFLDQLIDELSA
ncbi:FadR/GntR family transcriptional regulator [Conexibacter sp. JD483]|uniref:FadR/GntR family transcriptional regulator n=1 Tax=unclassified Conexibacter TaxID=2627773 RepID=UPI002721B78E|nr:MULTISPECIES: FadR/GntR family transcriptional regulator [unclassified Conexibacter]MDO8187420.1 FadR/GntR family transcriptional regulator [Conexibacter sp. CPCC 205706]MDO8201015.1 FadR/GntR family transcriptional regulator [Conexibacter sp. CPCC 205762]MDR9370306.1 FadR/GntR family transcriptional regulator [Conexibacter sp. JD483]